MKENREILYIEDDPASARLVSRGLNQLCRTIVRETGQAGLDYIASNPVGVGLILVDINLKGGMSGLEVIRILREQGYNKPIVALSAQVLASIEGCIVVEKPVDMGALRNIVSEALLI